MRIEFQQRAGAGERFADGAFDNQIGKTVRVTVDGDNPVSGVVVKADVHISGLWVDVTLELPDANELLERSSLGTPGAKKLRARTPQGVIDDINRRILEEVKLDGRG